MYISFFIFGGLSRRYASKNYYPQGFEKPSTKSKSQNENPIESSSGNLKIGSKSPTNENPTDTNSGMLKTTEDEPTTINQQETQQIEQ